MKKIHYHNLTLLYNQDERAYRNIDHKLVVYKLLPPNNIYKAGIVVSDDLGCIDGIGKTPQEAIDSALDAAVKAIDKQIKEQIKELNLEKKRLLKLMSND